MRRIIRKLLGIQDATQRAIAGTVTLQAALGDATGRQMTIQTYIYDGETKDELEKRVDVGQEVIERQKLRCEIPVLEATVEQRVKGLEQARDVLAELERRRNNGERLTTNELNNVMNLRTNINKQQEDIEKGIERIKEAKQKANVG